MQEIQILKYLEQNNQITRKEVEELLNVKDRRSNDILNEMIDKNLLNKKGTYKDAKYFIAK